VDEGLPIAYVVLDEGVPVFCCDGVLIGTVEQVLAARAQDIFHGIVVSTQTGSFVVAADDIACLHERRVDLRIDAAAGRRLPAPGGAAHTRRVEQREWAPDPVEPSPGSTGGPRPLGRKRTWLRRRDHRFLSRVTVAHRTLRRRCRCNRTGLLVTARTLSQIRRLM
jgi:hypothetical protein